MEFDELEELDTNERINFIWTCATFIALGGLLLIPPTIMEWLKLYLTVVVGINLIPFYLWFIFFIIPNLNLESLIWAFDYFLEFVQATSYSVPT